MTDSIRKGVYRLLNEYDDYAGGLPPEAFATRMPGRSNAIGEQLWCVVGGRESGVRAFENEKWMGFNCSLTETSSKERVIDALTSSADLVRSAFEKLEWSQIRERAALSILEHEAMHQGQLIRFGYALDLAFPESWAKHWSLAE